MLKWINGMFCCSRGQQLGEDDSDPGWTDDCATFHRQHTFGSSEHITHTTESMNTLPDLPLIAYICRH